MCSIRIEILGDETYTVEVTLEKPADGNKKEDYPRHVSKEFSAQDIEEVKSLIDEYLPHLKPRAEVAEFDEAFSQATKD